MKKSTRSFKPVQALTGKYGALLLTAMNAVLACLTITLSRYWSSLGTLQTATDFMTFFLPDYRFGFVSRALVGSALYLFTDHPTVRIVSTVLYVVVFCVGALFCFLQAKLAKKTLLACDYATLVLGYVFFLNKLFWWNTVQEIGMLDVFMTLLAQGFLLAVERKRTLGYCLAPVVCFLGLLVHTAFFFAGFPVVAAILWYELLKQGKPNRLCGVMFAVTCVVSVALFAMFTLFPQKFVRVAPDEMIAMLKAKYDGDIQDTYLLSHMFRTNAEQYPDTIDAAGFLQYAATRTDFFSPKLRRCLWNLLPLSIPYVYGCVSHARRSGHRLIAYLGCIAPLVTLFPSLHFSSDKERHFSLCILALYMLFHYLSTQSDVRFLPAADDLRRKERSARDADKRRKNYAFVLIACTAAGLVFSFVGAAKL